MTTILITPIFRVWDLAPNSLRARACTIADRNLTQAEWQRYLPDVPYQIRAAFLVLPLGRQYVPAQDDGREEAQGFRKRQADRQLCAL